LTGLIVCPFLFLSPRGYNDRIHDATEECKPERHKLRQTGVRHEVGMLANAS
jgi:hypothetical protein